MGTGKSLISHLIISAFLMIFTLSCAGSKQSEADAPPKIKGTPVTVIDYSELDGCEFLLQLENGEKLQPVNLDPKYKVNGLKIFVTWKTVDGMGICMSGKMVELLSVQEAENQR